MMLPSYLATFSLAGVMIPSMSAVSYDRNRMASTYRNAVSYIGLIGFPLATGLAVTAPEAIRLVYGTKWAAVVPLLFWLSIAGIAQPIHNTIGWLYIAVGKTRQMFLWGLIASLVLSAGFFLGVRWGARGVAISYAAQMLFVLTIPALYFAHRAAAMSLLDTLLRLKRAFIASIVMGLLVWLSGQVMISVNVPWGTVLIVKLAIGILVYALLCKNALARLGSELSRYNRVSEAAS
jgi:PST family polysaccharide transporter